jgi:hypothetical protein
MVSLSLQREEGVDQREEQNTKFTRETEGRGKERITFNTVA